MKLPISYLVSVCFLTLVSVSCQKSKDATSVSENQARPQIAILSKTTYNLGDTIPLQLSEPLTQVRVQIDSVSALVLRQTADSLAVSTSSAKQIGLHQLIVQGVRTNNAPYSDTLGIELWSDVSPAQLDYSVVKTYPHQASSFTQGLEFYKGALYESTGLNGQSKLMQVDLPTGAIIKSVPLGEQYFGEGITIVNDKIYQLTWTSNTCFQYTMDFVLAKTFSYPTQGWGLTHRDSTLILSDGSNRLYYYTPDFRRIGEVVVYDDKGPIMNLNELEYIDGYVFANIWQTNRIVQIDLASGKVVGNLNMERILPTSIDTKTNVLNGIAYQPQEKALYVTGKNWPTLSKIKLKQPLKKPETLVASR
ncbi:glutaminyl-peptide cyclotransferase [Spirosoma soli]|uniref:Glutaminyl-peptide cyclotransferase n=1 Tax=Spirosoma soli TaxID=1770529 RepID=A0ABW5MAY5_9BACT